MKSSSSLFKKKPEPAKKEEDLKVEPAPQNSTNEDLSWLSLLAKLNELNSSNKVKVKLRNTHKTWRPFINDVKNVVQSIKEKHQELLAPDMPNEPKSEDPFKKFIAVADTMVKKADLLAESVSYDLYIMPDAKAVTEVKADYAVIIYMENGEYFARILAKKNRNIPENVDTVIPIPKKKAHQIGKYNYVEKINTLKNQKNENNEVIITESNINLVDELTRKLASKAGIKAPSKSLKDLLTGAISLADDLPTLLDAFEQIPIIPTLTEKLTTLKTERKDFSFSHILKTILPIDRYRKLRKKAFKALEPENFNMLSLDEKALALSLMETYNKAIKFALLTMDRIEIENGLIAGALSKNIAIIDETIDGVPMQKTIHDLCIEFNEKYKSAMTSANFTIEAELYPYDYSILEQRRAMLAKLTTEDKNKASRNRIETRIQQQGEVKELPKRENPENFYLYAKDALKENYKKLQDLKNQLAPQDKDEKIAAQQYNEKSALFLWSTDSQELLIDESILLFAKNAKTPLLIRQNDKFFIYGFQKEDKGWKLTEVEDTNNNYKQLPFNSDKLITLKHSNLLFTKELATDLKQGHTYDSFTHEAKSIIAIIEKELQKMLDEKIYNMYFINETEAGPELPWIQEIANAYHTINKIIKHIEQLEQPYHWSANNKDANTPFSYLENRLNEANKLFSAGTELLIQLNELQKNPHLRKLIPKIKVEAMTKISKTKNTLEVYSKEMDTFFGAIKQSATPLQTAIKKLHAETPGNIDTVRLVVGLESLYKAFDQASAKNQSLVAFTFNHFTEISSLLISLPDILSVLSKSSKEKTMEIAKEINAALKQLVLLADKLEIQLCLKEGYLTDKLRPMIIDYTKAINKLGYDFPSKDRYPFLDEIDSQRETLLNDDKSPWFQKKLIINRRKSGLKEAYNSLSVGNSNHNHDAAMPKQIITKEPIGTELKQKWNNAITLHINNLNLELLKNSAFSQKISKETKEIKAKIELFKHLKSTLSDAKQARNLDDLLKQFKIKHPNDAHMLYEEDNHSFLKKLELENASPEDLSNVINSALAQLKKQRGETHPFANLRLAQLLEERINACEALKLLIKDHNLNDAINALSPNHQQLLRQHDLQFINHLKSIESALPIMQRPKTILGKPQVKMISTHSTNTNENTSEKEFALKLINEKLSTLQTSAFNKKGIKKLKIQLLTEFTNELKNHSIEDAIKSVKSKNPKEVYLLFEGRTGKILQMAQNLSITKTELLLRLDTEINALKEEKFTHLRVFAQSRKEKIDHQIEALQNLKSKIHQSTKSVKDIINELSIEEKNTLHRYEPDLFNAFNKEASNRASRAAK